MPEKNPREQIIENTRSRDFRDFPKWLIKIQKSKMGQKAKKKKNQRNFYLNIQ